MRAVAARLQRLEDRNCPACHGNPVQKHDVFVWEGEPIPDPQSYPATRCVCGRDIEHVQHVVQFCWQH